MMKRIAGQGNQSRSRRQGDQTRSRRQGQQQGNGTKKQKRWGTVVYIAVLLSAILITVSVATVNKYMRSLNYPTPYYELVQEFSKKYNVEIPLIYAIMKAESRFDTNAVSPAGAYGLMQIMPDTAEGIARDLKVKDYDDSLLLDPRYNIEFGSWHINWLMKRENLHYAEGGENIETIAAAYNAGHSNVEKWLKDLRYSSDGKTLKRIPFGETDTYVQRVKDNYHEYKIIFDEIDKENNKSFIERVLRK